MSSDSFLSMKDDMKHKHYNSIREEVSYLQLFFFKFWSSYAKVTNSEISNNQTYFLNNLKIKNRTFQKRPN